MLRVIHFESGLGNQMLDYCDYIAVKKMNPQDRCLAEAVVYDIPQCNEVIAQWNGLEIERIFGIKLERVSDRFSAEEWEDILNEIRNTEFWRKNWNYPKYVVEAFNRHGMTLRSEFCDFDQQAEMNREKNLLRELIASPLGQSLKRMVHRVVPQTVPLSNSFVKKPYDTFEGHTLCYMFRGAGIEQIEKEIRAAFIFPELSDKKNVDFANLLGQTNSVAVHIRAGDAMVYNRKYLERHYIHRAIKFMKKKVEDPRFYIFGNPSGLSWFKNNVEGSVVDGSEVVYVDWNCGENSYIDMQLMSLCKHNIILFSSFAWWASYLNQNPNKITIAPEPKMLTTHWM